MLRGARFLSAAMTVAIAITLLAPAMPARAAAGYDSAYQFESAFLTLHPGDSGIFSVFFANTGTASWVKGGGSQVNLAICAADKVTCNTTSSNAAFALGWTSPTAYATHSKDIVIPGDFSAFTYSISVPRTQAVGTYRFNGDLVLASTVERINPDRIF